MATRHTTVGQRGTNGTLGRKDVRRRLKKEVAKVVLSSMDRGFTVRDLGHGVCLFCPCGARDHRPLSVSATPKYPGREARRIAHELALLPCQRSQGVKSLCQKVKCP